MKGKLLTQYASHANTIADTFRAAFAKTNVGGLSVEMTAPTDSTKGGLLALQHVMLKPKAGMGLVVGTLNAGEKRAELRSYLHVANLNEERFKRPLSFDEPAYKAFLEKAEAVLGAFGIETHVTDAPRDVDPAFEDANAANGASGSRTRLIVAALVALGIVVGAVWFALYR